VIAIQERDRTACAKYIVVRVRRENKDGFVSQILQAGLLGPHC
jgi:hypothetical protein